MPHEKSTRRDFLKTTFISGIGAFLFPVSIRASSEKSFNRKYALQGNLSINFFPFSFDIHGNLNFKRNGGTYESQIESFLSENAKPSYSIYSKCIFQDGILTPKKTITEIDVSFLIWKYKRVKRLQYEVKEGRLFVEGLVESYNPDGTLKKTKTKSYKHDSLGLDYISSVLRLMLDARNSSMPEEINLISGSGKLSNQKIFFEKTQEGRRISAVYENQPVESKERFISSPKDNRIQSQNHIQKRKASITLDFDKKNELTHIILSHEYGEINADVKRIL